MNPAKSEARATIEVMAGSIAVYRFSPVLQQYEIPGWQIPMYAVRAMLPFRATWFVLGKDMYSGATVVFLAGVAG